MADDVVAFYDDLSEHYHHLHRDWRVSVRWQGECLAGLLAAELGGGKQRVLDCSCGIGTQAIGLALAGHAVIGTDLSAAELERAAREAASFGVELPTRVLDMRELAGAFAHEFDAVISCDNAIAHLEPHELPSFFASVRSATAPGGAVVVSVRDYAPLRAERPRVMSTAVAGSTDERRISFQVWDWDALGESYVLEQYVVLRDGDRCDVRCVRTRLFAHVLDAVLEAATAAGLVDARALTPGESGYYQPLVVARNGRPE